MGVRRFNARPSADYTGSPHNFEASAPGGDEIKFYICDTLADLPPSGINPGDQAYVISNNTVWYGIDDITWGQVTGGASDHGALTGLTDDDHPQYLLTADAGSRAAFAAAWTDLTDGGATVLHSHSGGGYTDEEAQDAVGTILTDSATIDLTYNDGVPSITASVIQSALDHGSIGGLTDDDHSIYALLAGRSGGQTLIGGTAADDDLNFESTSHGTKGVIRLRDTVELADNGLTVPGEFLLYAANADSPAIQFDANDYFFYDRVGDSYSFRVAGVTRWEFDAASAVVNNPFQVNGTLAMVDDATLYSDGFETKQLIFQDLNGNPTIALRAPDALSVTTSVRLPADTPAVNEYLMVTSVSLPDVLTEWAPNPVTAHLAVGDPHVQYRLEADDHTHASSGAQGGTVAHSALTGLTTSGHPAAIVSIADAGSFITGTDVEAALQEIASTNTRRSNLHVYIQNAGATIVTGIVRGQVVWPFDGVVTGWTILSEQSGSIVVDVWKDSYANYPPTVADTVAGSEKPTLSAASKNQDLALGSFSTAVSLGDIWRFNVDSITTLTDVTIIFHVLQDLS